MDPQKHPRKKNPLNSYARFSGIALQMIVIIGLGSFGGVKLDEAYPNQYHVFTLVCSLGSVALAMYMVVKQVSNISKKQNSSNG
ncbi:AtpZ/AtpI family protein [Flavobacteriaceae bacterium 3-367]|uniref:AtpZ/AtpI family protein n=1 Tax=Eudoraea algarum TaxID=3417568 RepID=UPI003294AF19